MLISRRLVASGSHLATAFAPARPSCVLSNMSVATARSLRSTASANTLAPSDPRGLPDKLLVPANTSHFDLQHPEIVTQEDPEALGADRIVAEP